MTGLEALQSVQYVASEGRRYAVVEMVDWEALIEWLETLEDATTIKEAYAKLEAVGGDRKQAGWMRWQDISEDLA